MFIKRINLKHFRNYTNQNIELGEKINVFYGNNAQGKTNILEALYFCALGRSFRTYKESELIEISNKTAQIEVIYEKNQRENKIEIEINQNDKKMIYLNQIKLNKNSELVGNINLVIFSPDDINILKQGPALRRKFLDILISQLKPKYLYELSGYNKILEQRNACLKQKKTDLLEVWNEQLVHYAEKIYQYRTNYIDKIKEKVKKIHPEITSEKEEMDLVYKSDFKDKDSMQELLMRNESLDILRGYTTKGIHRDDFSIFINQKELSAYGSQGQHRTAILSLKLAELQIVQEEILENPILLLDDITSELDRERIRLIFENIKDYQVLITCTDINSILKYESLTKDIKLYNIKDGKVI